MNWKRIAVSVMLVLAIFIFCYGYYVWNKPHRDVSKEKGIKISAIALFDSFRNNEKNADSLFLNKAVEVTGKVTNVKTNNAGQTVVYLQSHDPLFGINCTFVHAPGSIQKNMEIVFKGICTGYLDDVILNNGELINKSSN